MGLAIFAAVLALVLSALVYHARRRYRRSTSGASGLDYSRPAGLAELVPALAHAGLLELTATCAVLLVVALVALVLRALS
jgi:hypothetical protein